MSTTAHDNVRQRGSTFQAYWYKTDPATGKRVQYTKSGFTSRTAAKRYAKSMSVAVQEKRWQPEAKLTVSQLIHEHWLPSKANKRPATRAGYANAAKWLEGIGAVEVRQLTPAHVQRLQAELRASGSRLGRGGLSDRSVQLAVLVLTQATAWAAKTGLVMRDPLAYFEKPKDEGVKKGAAWSLDEAKTFLQATAGSRMGAVWHLAVARGLRRGELCGLKWDKVDLDGGQLWVERTRVVVDGKAVDQEVTKTSGSRRRVPLDAGLVAALRAHRTRQAQERLAAGEAYRVGDYVVADELGRPYHPESVAEMFDQAVKTTGVPRRRLHDCRHTAVSLMWKAGVKPKTAATLVGHKSTRMIDQVYLHLGDEDVNEGGQAMGELLAV